MKICTLSRLMSFIGLLAVVSPVGATEYFVGKQGDDANRGQTRDKAFLTVQKGVAALQPGDTLTIGPGEYFGTMQRQNLGNPDVDTVIRAEISGTAVLRGDVAAPAFKPVDGYRFVYAAPFEQTPKAVLEHDTLHVMLEKANVPELEFDPGFFHYDVAAKRLYISRSDLLPPDGCRYTVAVNEKSGLELNSPRRVIIEGLTATGFYPGWGILLTAPVACTIRDCVSFMNVGGINLCPFGQIEGDGGSHNVVEQCVCYGNTFAGISRYGANNDIIRNCYTYKNVREGSENFGIMHYLGMGGPLVIRNNLSWGQSFDYSVKPVAKEILENCVALGYIRNANMTQNLIGGGNEYDRSSSTASADNILFLREQKNDMNVEFADPLNLDFRLQPESRFRGTAPDKTDRGPFPYTANVFYVSPAGDDQADGLSLSKSWRTMDRAIKGLRPGDTLYLEHGDYSDLTWKGAGGGEKPINIRGRGREPVRITGRMTIARGAGLAFERLNFIGGVALDASRDMTFNNCTFSGTADGMNAEAVKGLRLTHVVFWGVSLNLKKSSGVYLSGNIYANTGKPPVQMDAAEAIRYSDYNTYQEAKACWQVKGATLSFDDLQKQHDRYSLLIDPQLSQEAGVPVLKNTVQFKGRGPHSTTPGIYHEYEITAKALDLVGPFLHSASDTTANLEWWSSRSADFTLTWGDTPAMKNTVSNLKGPERFNTFSLTGLKPGQTYYFKIQSAKPTGLDAVVLKPENAPLSFTTAFKALEPRVYYVATTGNDGNSGLSREQACRTVSRAASLVGPGDTVMITSGDYNETVRIRAAGTKERPITFRSAPGEKAVFIGDNLSRTFEAIWKPDLRFDGLYFRAQGFWGQGVVVRQSARLQFTRCFYITVTAEESPGMRVQNCVAVGGWTAVSLSRCPDSRVENNVFIMTILRQLVCDESTVVRGNIFCECVRNKTHQTLLELSAKVAESNNCFYLRWPEDEKLVINSRPLTEYRVRSGSDSMAANPMMPGNPGRVQGWQQAKGKDFDAFFATNPELVKRGIGLQPEVFRDLQGANTTWPYDVTWAEKVMARTQAAEALAKGGKDNEALVAYSDMVAKLPMTDRLKAEFLDQAAQCANRLKNYTQAMDLAKRIPLKPLSARRQMAILVEQGNYAEILNTFISSKMDGQNFYQSWTYPEQEDVMADLYYYRSLAYVKANDLVAAEADLRIMNEKRAKLTYRSGESIHDLVWLRLGDFYRTQLKDDDRALEAYRNVLDRTTWSFWGRPRKPVARGADETLVAATKATAEILRHKGREAEISQLQFNLLQAQAEATAGLLKESETIAKFKELLKIPGKFTPEMEVCVKRISGGDAAVREKVLAGMKGMATGLTEDTRDLLVKAASGSEEETRQTALRALLMFVPLDMVNELVSGSKTGSP